jgi:hypothetical protein
MDGRDRGSAPLALALLGLAFGLVGANLRRRRSRSR